MTEHADFDLELRFVDSDAGAMTGICVPYNRTTFKAAGAPNGERFLPGAFKRSIEVRRAKSIRLSVDHDQHRNAWVGVATDLVDTDAGLQGTFRFYDWDGPQEVRRQAREGLFGGLSVGFKPRQERTGLDGVREIVEAELHHVGLVDEPAYDGAAVLAVRETRPAARSPYADWTPPAELIEIPNVFEGP